MWYLEEKEKKGEAAQHQCLCPAVACKLVATMSALTVWDGNLSALHYQSQSHGP